jgi:hypothetical protein
VVRNVTSIAGVLDEETAGMMGIEGYKLPEDLDKIRPLQKANLINLYFLEFPFF